MWPTATMTPPRLAPITSPVTLASNSFSCLMRNHASAYCEPCPLKIGTQSASGSAHTEARTSHCSRNIDGREEWTRHKCVVGTQDVVACPVAPRRAAHYFFGVQNWQQNDGMPGAG